MLDVIWDETYSVHIAEIDRQHKSFTALLDTLFEAIEAGRSQEVLAGILQDLIVYADYHFSTEEQLMIKHRYPELGAHHKEHESFRSKLLEFGRSLREGGETLAIDMAKFMTHWITDHVMNTDRKYAPFLRERGVA